MPNLPPPSRQSPPISPPNPPSAPRDLGPTLSEGNPEPESSNKASVLEKEKDDWERLPEAFFASAPIYVEKYNRSSQPLAVAGEIAFRLRTGEFYRCRSTWGQRGKKDFLERVSKYNPELSQVDYGKWMNFGKTTDIISRNCIPGTIVASCLSSLDDSRYRMVPLDENNKEHISFLKELRKPETQSLAAGFAGLEQALKTYIYKAYSGLRKRVTKSLEYDQLQDFSLQQAGLSSPLYVGSRCDPLPAEPCQDMVIDSFPQEPTLDNIGRNGPVAEEQLPYPDQQPQATEECSKILTPIYVFGQSHEGGAYPMSGQWQNDVQQLDGVTGQPSQQPPQPVTSFSVAHDTWPISSQHCSVGSMLDSERTQTDRSQPIISTSQGNGYGQVPAHSWPSTVGIPVQGCVTSWMDDPQHGLVPEAPPGWTEYHHTPNCHAQINCCRDYGVTAAMTPQKPTANIAWIHAHFEGPVGLDGRSLLLDVDFPANDQTLLGLDGSILGDSSVAAMGVETSTHQAHRAVSSQGPDFPLERGKTSMRAVADMEQRIRC